MTGDDEEIARDRLRNIGIVAHINAGKTTLSEHFLFVSGKQRWLGEVEAGTATMDWMVEEQRRGISITAAVTSFDWSGHRIQLIDTPGHVDFTAEVERCMRVLDGVVVVVDGVRGVESQTETVWRHAEQRGLPCLIFVNKLDRATADFDASVASIRRRWDCRVAEVVWPVYADGVLVGVFDALSGTTSPASPAVAAQVPADLADSRRQALIDICAEFDDEIVESFVAGRSIPPAQLRGALQRLVAARRVMPVLSGSALRDIGVEALLDAVCAYLPAPPSSNPYPRHEFTALLYKVHVEQDKAGNRSYLGFVRVMTGSLARGDEVEFASTGQRFFADALFRMHAMEREPVARAVVGDFVALRLPMTVVTGDTLRCPGSDCVLEPMRFSEPVLTMALEPKSSESRSELEARAIEIAAEDPTLDVRHDPLTDQLLVSGMGELHLEVFRNRLDRRLTEPARFGRPSVARYESVAGSAEERAEIVRRVGGVDLTARVRIAVAPTPTNAIVEVVDARDDVVSRSDADPHREVIAAVVASLRSQAKVGIAAPMPSRGFEVRITSFQFEPNPVPTGLGSTEFGVDIASEAALVACRRALITAGRIVLEPIVDFVVEGPSESFGTVLADLRSRGVEIAAVVPSFGTTRVTGSARLATLLGYASPLRSMTQGKGSLHFELRTFAPAP